MSKLTGKFFVIDGVRFVQVQDEADQPACCGCAFHWHGCLLTREQIAAERDQGLDCATDEAHYEVAQ